MKNIILGFVLILISPYVLAASDDWTGKFLKCDKKSVKHYANSRSDNPKEGVEEFENTEFYRFTSDFQLLRMTVYYTTRSDSSSHLDIRHGTYGPIPNMVGYMDFAFESTFKNVTYTYHGDDNFTKKERDSQQNIGRLYFDRQKLLLKAAAGHKDNHILTRECKPFSSRDEFESEANTATDKMFDIVKKERQKIINEKKKNKM